jgi:DNA-binding GntR family transcriptional regulator
MKEHRDILTALEKGDAKVVEVLMREHIRIQSSTYEEFRNETTHSYQ